jgi:hypothetical protein
MLTTKERRNSLSSCSGKHRYVFNRFEDGPLLPVIWVLAQWLWKGAQLITGHLKEKGMGEMWQEILSVVK